MSASQKKTAANRKNAKRSTGPKTVSGKQKASRNATTHGAFAHDLIIRTAYLQENPAEYERLLRSITDEFQPDTLLQESLVRKIADCVWRSRRIVAAETAHIVHAQSSVRDTALSLCRISPAVAELHNLEIPEPDIDHEEELARQMAALRTIPDQKTARHLLYYEMRLDRQLSRTYRLFRQLKRSARIDKAIAAAGSSSAKPPSPASPDNTYATHPATPDNVPDSATCTPDLSTPAADQNMGSPLFDETNPIVDCPPTT